MTNQVTYEIYWLRFISCLSVVMVHAISSAIYLSDFEPLEIHKNTLLLIQLFMMFATPSFIFISEFLLSKAYPYGLPINFFKNRLKYLLVPYLSMSLVYAIIFVENFSLTNIFILFLRHALLGDFVAYFVLIIFQFYILHYIAHRKIGSLNPLIVIGASFLINAGYLGFFVLTNPPIENSLVAYFWGKGHWMLFPAWLFYFSIGYYSGKHYSKLLAILNKYKKFVLIAPILTFSLLIFMTEIGFPIGSKRIDVIFHTTAIILLVLLVSSKLKKPPKIVLTISKYSFGIYLLHKLVVDTVKPFTDNIFIHVILLFIIGVVFSIIVMFLFNQLPYGKYVTGQIGKIRTNTNSCKKELKRQAL